MTANMIALGLTAVISSIIPLIIFVVVLVKCPMERKKIVVAYILGIICYILMQWGAKEHGLTYLFNHTKFTNFMNNHYIPYLLAVALTGAVLALIPELLVIQFVFKKQMSFAKAAMFGLGYGMTEAFMLVGYRSIITIIELAKGTEMGLDSSTTELFLSGYERALLILIQTAIVVTLVYFIQQKMYVRGSIVVVVWSTLTSFLPGFFIAFSLTNYYELYSRKIALVLVYTVLTVAGLCSVVVLNSLKYALKDEEIDSPKALATYRRKLEEKENKKKESKEKKAEKKPKKEKNS